jgi:hypothetical protein
MNLAEKSSAAEQKLRGSLAVQKPPGVFSRFFQRGVTAILRERREPVVVVGALVLVDKSIPLDGLVTEIAADGALFRTASSYIMDRTRSEVLLRFAEREVRGRIVATTARGYEVTFAQPLPAAAVAEIAGVFGGSAAAPLQS